MQNLADVSDLASASKPSEMGSDGSVELQESVASLLDQFFSVATIYLTKASLIQAFYLGAVQVGVDETQSELEGLYRPSSPRRSASRLRTRPPQSHQTLARSADIAGAARN